jgi:hypothetical protein
MNFFSDFFFLWKRKCCAERSAKKKGEKMTEASGMEHHKQEIRGSVTLTQHILLSQRDYPVRFECFVFVFFFFFFFNKHFTGQEATGQLTILLTAIVNQTIKLK